MIQNTQEIKTTLFNETKQDKTCKFSRKASFSSYVQQYYRKQLNQLILGPFDARRLAGGKGKLPRKFSRFVLFRLIDKRSFNLSCILDLFAERWQSTLFQMFLFFFTLCMPDHCFTQHLRGKGSRCLPDTLCMPDTLQPLFKHCACLILYSRCLNTVHA